jgi:hypothetical protein
VLTASTDHLLQRTIISYNVVSRSSAEAEYRTVANGVAQASWMRQLLHELHSPLQRATLVYYDNISAIYLSTNLVQHQHTNHVEVDLHFVRERVAAGDVWVLRVPTTVQFADIFTKGLSSSVFLNFWSSLNICTGKSCDCKGVLEYPLGFWLSLVHLPSRPYCNGPGPTTESINTTPNPTQGLGFPNFIFLILLLPWVSGLNTRIVVSLMEYLLVFLLLSIKQGRDEICGKWLELKDSPFWQPPTLCLSCC